jgi:flagellar hook-associated protein 1 FlgK
MASTFGGFEIARSGMMAYNAAIQTTAHNIANVDTKGYSKQVANMSSLVSNKSSYVVQGAGVVVTDISRERNEYYDVKFQSTQAAYSYYDAEESYLKDMENILASDLTSDTDNQATISSAFDDFNATLSNLVGSPNDGTIRQESVTTAQTFTEFVNKVANELQDLQEQLNSQIKTSVQQINSYAEKIVALTKEINTLEAYGTTANDLRDQRTVLVDELSQYCSVETVEKAASDAVGDNQFYVYLNGSILVDTYHANKLVAVQKDTYGNINDISGCYDIQWADGTTFNNYSTELGGQLQALFEIRDGNNGVTLSGTVKTATGPTEDDPTIPAVLTVTGTNCNDVNKLNIPSHDGEITISGYTYSYSSFDVDVDGDGNFTYTFQLKDVTNVKQTAALQKAAANGYTATVGTEVNFRGIPYYMAQLNEFVRTYSEEFNRIQNQGYDNNGNLGVDFFNATIPTGYDNYVMQEKIDGVDSSFSSLATQNTDGTYTGSYYYMTALNFCVTSEVVSDPSLIAAKENKEDGSDNAVNLQKMTELKDKATMFIYGTPDSFIQAFTSTVGVDCNKATALAENQSNLLYMVDSSRQSISGVDEDEEGADLLVFQQMLYNQYKVISVMAEVLDKLINETGV